MTVLHANTEADVEHQVNRPLDGAYPVPVDEGAGSPGTHNPGPSGRPAPQPPLAG